MDTTIRNLDEAAYRRIKARAALEGRTLGEAVSEAIRRYLESEPAGVAAEAADRGGGYGEVPAAAEAGGPPGAGLPGPPRGVAPPTLAECLERLAELGRPDPGFADDLEAIQAAQPRIGPGAWES